MPASHTVTCKIHPSNRLDQSLSCKAIRGPPGTQSLGHGTPSTDVTSSTGSRDVPLAQSKLNAKTAITGLRWPHQPKSSIRCPYVMKCRPGRPGRRQDADLALRYRNMNQTEQSTAAGGLQSLGRVPCQDGRAAAGSQFRFTFMRIIQRLMRWALSIIGPSAFTVATTKTRLMGSPALSVPSRPSSPATHRPCQTTGALRLFHQTVCTARKLSLAG